MPVLTTGVVIDGLCLLVLRASEPVARPVLPAAKLGR
ncbi:hypothetical protein BACT_1145 [Bifidobacterium actinocoloniiforme DSM 22766]|uniref:Uncharacterized protein n=1 Tax=Bifidobacterium actinocoloniiforme DSM 22766 TaxID=1437605 RepID=A0A086Z1P1_9BIFI|nr:hypothetical protein BACT_1145 [Bifidobacterium actinocoloniiforme DSM 22766]